MTKKNNKKARNNTTFSPESSFTTAEEEVEDVDVSSHDIMNSPNEHSHRRNPSTAEKSPDTLRSMAITGLFPIPFLPNEALAAELPTYHPSKDDEEVKQHHDLSTVAHTEENIRDRETPKVDDINRSEVASEDDDGVWRTVTGISREQTEEYLDKVNQSQNEDPVDTLPGIDSPERFAYCSTPYGTPMHPKIDSHATSSLSKSSENNFIADMDISAEKTLNFGADDDDDDNESFKSENIVESVVLLFGYWKSSWIHKLIMMVLQNKIIRMLLKIISPITAPMLMIMRYAFNTWLSITLFVLDMILHRIMPVMERLVNLWLYVVLLPYHITKWMIQRSWRIFLLVLVYVLNRSPGGQKVLKALNGHIMKH